MKVIFLDFDGVMITKESNFRAIGRYEAQLLNKIARETGAAVVVTSTWRNIGIGRCRAMLREAGYTEKFAGGTPIYAEGTRAQEIGSWLFDHPGVERIVILDDHPVGGFDSWLVQTETLIGLTYSATMAAIALLNREVGDDGR